MMPRCSLCALLASLTVSVFGTAQDAPRGDPRAAALLAEASKNRYTWSPDVAAVSGKFIWKQNGKATAGAFRGVLGKFHGMTIDAADPEVKKELRGHLSSHLNHRTSGSSNTPAPSVIIVEDEARGPLIMPIGDPLHSTHRVKDGKLVEVNRMMRGQRFTIDTTGYEKSADGRFYPSHFTVTWWDAATGARAERKTYTTQGFHIVDGLMFPRGETIVTEKDGKSTTIEITYSQIHFEKANKEAAAPR